MKINVLTTNIEFTAFVFNQIPAFNDDNLNNYKCLGCYSKNGKSHENVYLLWNECERVYYRFVELFCNDKKFGELGMGAFDLFGLSNGNFIELKFESKKEKEAFICKQSIITSRAKQIFLRKE